MIHLVRVSAANPFFKLRPIVQSQMTIELQGNRRGILQDLYCRTFDGGRSFLSYLIIDEDNDGSVRFRVTPAGIVREIRFGPSLAELLAYGWREASEYEALALVDPDGAFGIQPVEPVSSVEAW